MTPVEEFQVDTLVIGAGLIGSSTAMHLAQQGVEDVHVIDFDLEGTFSSSELNAGGVRATWNLPINIELSKRSIEYFESVADEVGFKACGYLWLKSPEQLPAAEKALHLQQKMGWGVEAWDLPTLQKNVPFIDKMEGLAAAFCSPRDGLINPNLLKIHYRGRARKGGAKFHDRTLLRTAEYSGTGVILDCERYVGPMSHEMKLDVLKGKLNAASWEPVRFRAKRVVNCAGAWSGSVAPALGYSSPAKAIRRQVCIFDCRDVDLTLYGMIVDTSGVYFHHEASNGLAGFATPGEPEGVNYEYDGESFFMEVIWPALYERSSKFERLRHVTGWAGLYEVSPDETAILGEVKNGVAGKSGRVYEAHAFSGRGAMQSYEAGKLLSQKILSGKYTDIDAEPLNAERFQTGKELRETQVI